MNRDETVPRRNEDPEELIDNNDGLAIEAVRNAFTADPDSVIKVWHDIIAVNLNDVFACSM